MAEIVWTAPALNNLNDIAEYIALHNLSASKKLVASVFDSVERLSTFPMSGKIADEIANLSIRELLVNPCRIFYKFENNTVYILFVMRQEQDLRRFLLSQ